jgi:hypothetical protein
MKENIGGSIILSYKSQVYIYPGLLNLQDNNYREKKNFFFRYNFRIWKFVEHRIKIDQIFNVRKINLNKFILLSI